MNIFNLVKTVQTHSYTEHGHILPEPLNFCIKKKKKRKKENKKKKG
jgi:hypothetical protein